MKSPSNHSTYQEGDTSVEQRVNAALNQSVQGLSVKAQMDIAQARVRALSMARQGKPSLGMKAGQFMARLAEQSAVRLAVPMAAAVLIGVAVNYNYAEQVPELPLAMVTSQIPTEELTLLEDLDFVTWLAENEQEVLL